LETTVFYRISKLYELWSTNAEKSPKLLPTLRKFCILLHYQALHTVVSERTLIKLYQTLGVNRADKMTKNGVLVPKWAKNCIFLSFFDDFDI